MESFLRLYCQVTSCEAEGLIFEAPASSLLDRKATVQLLEETKALYDATGMELPASLIGLALFGPIAAMMIETAERGFSRNLSLPSLKIQLGMQNGTHPYLQLKTATCPAFIHKGGFSAEFLVENLTEPIENVASCAGVSPKLIWNQFGARILTIMDAAKERRPKIGSTLDSLISNLQQLPPGTFHLRKNPFVHSPVYIDNPYNPGTKTMIRSSCCMFFKRKNGAKCYNCPALSDAKREEMAKGILTQASE